MTRTYQLVLWMVPVVNKFPRDHRFTLGDRLVTHLYDLLKLLVEASYTKKKTDLCCAGPTSAWTCCATWWAGAGPRCARHQTTRARVEAFGGRGQTGGWTAQGRCGEDVKRTGGLWHQVLSLGNLLQAAREASRNKRYRPDVARFNLDLEYNLSPYKTVLIADG